jgi:hypothetical protein
MPLVQWIMQNLVGLHGSAFLKCSSSIFANGQNINARANLKCESKIYAAGLVLAGPISGTPTWENQWNLTGVYAILPNNYKKYKFILFILNYMKPMLNLKIL